MTYAWAAATFWHWADPGRLLPGLTFFGIVLLWTPWRRLGRVLATIGGVALLAVACLPVSGWLTQTLENRFPPPAELPVNLAGIIVLGGSVSPGLTKARGQPALNANAERLTEFIALARRYPGARLVFTGGGKSALLPSEAEVSLAVLRSVGFDVSRILVEERSTDTYGNALLARQLVEPRGDESWALITSAWHMPRAIGTFRAAGWNVVAVPVDYTTGGRPLGFGIGFDPTLRLAAFSLAAHEWLGLAIYRLLGRTEAWFPAP